MTATIPAAEQDMRRQRAVMLRGAVADARREGALAVVVPELLDAVLDDLDGLRAARPAAAGVVRHPDPERALLVARGEVDGDMGIAAAELAVEVANLHGELSAVLGEVRAMLDGPDHVRSAAARLLRKRIGGAR